MGSVTPHSILIVLGVYGMLFVVFLTYLRAVPPGEGKTFLVLGAAWGGTVFVANYLLHLAGLMSFLPWVNNALHTFVWIGLCLSWLYLGIRNDQPLFLQCWAFFAFSLIVKVAEHLAFGTWEHPHFFHVLEGQAAYVIGWSVLDGTYPIISRFGLRLLGKSVDGLVVT
jgi:hypothetical protein